MAVCIITSLKRPETVTVRQKFAQRANLTIIRNIQEEDMSPPD
jgi:hypothetical protein